MFRIALLSRWHVHSHKPDERYLKEFLSLPDCAVTCVWDEDYDELDEAYIQPKEFMETHCQRMNEMLQNCGMGVIDPRNVFDYLVLYCLRPEDKLFMSDRMALLASEIFHE
jgi:hypothetical protein